MAEQTGSDTKVSFKDTLNLPKTDFPIRPNAAIDDPELIVRWEQEQLYKKSFTHNAGAEKFVFHDGPPYANGPIHTGSAYNKILKDIVTKAQRMLGKQVPITPGWDCHGLPIEIKVTEQNPELSGSALKKACRAYAQRWIDIQRTEFKRLGVIMDWNNPYITMSPSYQASILRAFGTFVTQGLIERKNKAVPWCFSCKTVLASAEIEYQDRKDPSAYVLFPLDEAVVNAVLPACAGKSVNLLVWTTTPWTLPLNKAVLLKPNTTYTVLDIEGLYVIVGETLADSVCALRNVPKNVVTLFESNDLIGARAHHPFIDNLTVPILLDDSVATGEGTACVHCAPGAGPIDYEVGVKNNLEIYSPIAADGTYTDEVLFAPLIGLSVIDGQWLVLKTLKENGRLFYKTNIVHSYPHCWRCHNGLIFRATKQWFFDLEKGHIKERATALTHEITTYPEKSINRLRATIAGRLEWCLSRQREWGVPIPALVCLTCDTPYYSQKLANTVAKNVAVEGIEWWDDATLEDILPDGFVCSSCGGTDCKKETDILDVWFDSGLSHYAVLEQNPALGVPADLYLEGTDQHRGWFQSSLLTSVALRNAVPTRAIFTHCFVVDEKGHKMSKSLGNVIAPQELIDRLGTDGLRMWAASVDNGHEAVISQTVLNNVQEVFRKIRNTLRFLLSNLYDFDQDKDCVPLDKLPPLDTYALQELRAINSTVIALYTRFDTTGVFHALGEYCANQLSALYLDVIKDRLYVERADGHARRSAQTACYYILDTLTRLSAPIASFTAEQVSDLYQKNKTESIHLQTFATFPFLESVGSGSTNVLTDGSWDSVLLLRAAILKALEGKREIGMIKHPLEARVTVFFDPKSEQGYALQSWLERTVGSTFEQEQFLRELVIVSQFTIAAERGDLPESSVLEGVYIDVTGASGVKCPRCWQWDEKPQKHDLCRRCFALLYESTE
jgi:isoleucyl-tRNA synthetase